ncbi:uncharacterized protein BDV14DRAFT_185456 [Aspergillus stella-maris]|uniref:uncharacterized protein n=1 Tax=Aspergillus stella-maris TaxID=1810926 RepID=UPI003CCCD6E5
MSAAERVPPLSAPLDGENKIDKVDVPGEPMPVEKASGNQGAKTRTEENRPETVAIVGSGMAGLVTAHLLCHAEDRNGGRRFDVEVLEMQDGLSLDSASYTLPIPGFESESSGDGSAEGGRPGSSSGLSSASTLVSSSEKKKAPRDASSSQGARVDLPMRAFAAGYYDNLRRMYTYLGVRFGEPRFVYSLSRLPLATSGSGSKKAKEGGEAYFIHSSNNHILPPIRPPGVGLLNYVVEVAYLLFWYAWFTTACFFIPPLSTPSPSSQSTPQKPTSKSGTGETLHSYLIRILIPTYYTTTYFLPLMSSITTCTHEELLSFPASDIIGYAVQTFRKPHYTVTGGVKEAEGRLAGGFKVRYRTRVGNVVSLQGGRVKVEWTETKKDGEGQEVFERGGGEYDRVIIAVTPDVLGNIFAPLKDEMRSIPTTYVSTVVHTDFDRVRGISASVANDTRLQRRKIKTFLDTSTSKASKPTFHPVPMDKIPPLTAMHMLTAPSKTGTRTESIHEHPANVLVSTYAMEGIDESKILHSVRFTRVLRTSRSRDIVNSIFGESSSSPSSSSGTKSLCRESDGNSGSGSGNGSWKSGDGNVFVVGGWCWDGMVLLEGCIVSAMRVAQMLGIDVPWRGLP